MYEVFYNDRSIAIAGNSEQLLFNIPYRNTLINNIIDVPRHIIEFLAGTESLLILTDDPPEELWDEFKKFFTVVQAAGGVVQSKAGVLFIFRRGRWDLPKGKIDEGECAEDAALREVTEESGLTQLFIDGALPVTWHIYQSDYNGSKGEWILKPTYWFSMAGNSNEKTVPEKGEDIDEVRWFRYSELTEVLANTYPGLRKLISQIVVKRRF